MADGAPIKRIHLFVSGVVQGVCFRYYTKKMALELGLTGWVRNLINARVEILAEGNESSLKELVQWSRRGPPNARVDHVEETWLCASNEFSDFTVMVS